MTILYGVIGKKDFHFLTYRDPDFG